MEIKTIRAAIAAVCVAAALPSWANTAVWKSNADGDLSVASNWVDDYVPQAGDTIDFRNVTAKHSVYNDLTETVQYETVINHSNVMFRRREGCSDWCFAQVTFNQAGSNGGLGGGDDNNAARLTVAGRITLAGVYGLGTFGGNDIVTADEIVKTRSGDTYLVKGALRTNLSVVKARQFVQGGTSGFFALGTQSNSSNYGLDVVVGSGGFRTSGSLFFAVAYQTTVIHPSADYSFEANSHADNVAMMLYAGSTLKIHTTDYNDGVTPRTVTLEGGVAARKSGSPYGKLQILGKGVVAFSSCRESSSVTMPETTVSDTATVLVKDTSIIGAGAMSFASGTTLKVVQTSPMGIVELGGALTLAANSTLDFDLAANSATSALKVASLALPASGTVKVKLAESDAGRYALVENLPNGTTVDKFSAVNDSSTSSYLTLYVEGDKLIGVISKKAIWKSNADGDLSVASNWVDDYVPQAGDTIDFRNVTAKHSVFNDLTATVQYETVINHSNVMLRRREGCSDWYFAQATFNQSGSNGGLGGGDANNAARLTVAGRITIAGEKGLGAMGGMNIVSADEIVETRSSGNTYLVTSAVRSNLSVVKARQFVRRGTSGYFALGTQEKVSNYGLDIVVGSGGFQTSGALFFCVDMLNTTVIHPSADYSFVANTHEYNVAMMLYAGTTLKIHTTDYNDGVTPRTVTFEGGVAARKQGTPYGKLQILGTGVVDFSSCRESSTVTMPATTVSDTATVLVKDTSIIGSGAMSFASGTTLKVAQTTPTGIVELGGALTLAANSTLEFDLAANTATSALKVASLTMPASGKVRVKVSGVSSRGNYVLIDNLPAGTNAKQFELVEEPFDNAKLVVRNNQLILGRNKGLVIIIAGGGERSLPAGSHRVYFTRGKLT